MKKQLLLALFCGYTMFVNAQTAFTGCPDINLAILRSGNNSNTTNPVTISAVNTATGNISSTSIAIHEVATPSVNLQVNGLGLNTNDGFLYGLNANPPNPATPNVPLPFYRVGSDAVAQQVGLIATPVRTGSENLSFINSSAGEIDKNNNYYFTAATIIANTFTTVQISRMFIGKLPGVGALTAASANTTLTPTYKQIVPVDANALAYVTALTTNVPIASAAVLADAGIKDLVYDELSNSLLTYVTFPNPAPGATDYLGLMLKADPSNGNLTSIGAPTSLPIASATVDVSGTLLDKDGNFLILFTNGEIYRANTTMPGIFDGSITSINNNSTANLPTTLRGDLASCGAASSLLPILLNYFSVYGQNNTAVIKWETGSEINASRFVIERSTDGLSWSAIQTIASAGNSSTAKQYQYTDNNISAKTIFYRLKLIDIDGTAKYSVVKKVSFGTANITVSYYPNPVINTLYAESDAAFPDKLQVQISNAAGKTYATTFRRNSVNKISIDMSSFSAGIYFLQISNSTGNNSIQKIIKQ